MLEQDKVVLTTDADVFAYETVLGQVPGMAKGQLTVGIHAYRDEAKDTFVLCEPSSPWAKDARDIGFIGHFYTSKDAVAKDGVTGAVDILELRRYVHRVTGQHYYATDEDFGKKSIETDFTNEGTVGYLIDEGHWEYAMQLSQKKIKSNDGEAATPAPAGQSVPNMDGSGAASAPLAKTEVKKVAVAKAKYEIRMLHVPEREAILRALLREQFSVKLEWSVDLDEVFVLISAPYWHIEALAEEQRVRLRMRNTLGRDSHDASEQAPCCNFCCGNVTGRREDTSGAGYSEFSVALREQFMQGDDMALPYSLFRSSERYQIIENSIEDDVFPIGFEYDPFFADRQFFECTPEDKRKLREFRNPKKNNKVIDEEDKDYLSLGRCMRDGIVTDMFPLHEKDVQGELKRRWVSGIGRQPLADIRSYFGGAVAFYFAWAGHYSMWLIPPGILGTALFIYQLYRGDVDTIFLPFFCLLMAVWTAVYLEFWRRTQNELAFKWGLYNDQSRPRIRREFKGKTRQNPITGIAEIHYPAWRRRFKYLLGSPVISTFVVVVFGFIVALLFFKQTYTISCGQVDDCQNYIAAVANAVFVNVLNIIYSKVSLATTAWENHKTDASYESSLALKTFSFQFVNSFAALYYLAFVDGDLVGLAVQLALNLTIKGFIFNIKELAVPYIKRRRQQKANERARVEMEAAGLDADDVSPVESEATLAKATGTFADYAELALQYAYVTIFVSVLPVAPLLAVFANLIEIRVDATKFCFQQRREPPRDAPGIGTWFVILRTISVLAVVTNAALLSFNSSTIIDLEWMTPERQVWMVWIMEKVCLVLIIAIQALIPDVPAFVKREVERAEQIEDQALIEARREAKLALRSGNPELQASMGGPGRAAGPPTLGQTQAQASGMGQPQGAGVNPAPAAVTSAFPPIPSATGPPGLVPIDGTERK